MRAAKVVPLYKVLVDGCSVHGGELVWSLPTDDGPGDWHEVEGDVQVCHVGLHLTPDPSVWWRTDAEAYLVEAEGVVGDPAADTKVAAKRVRLLRRLSWVELAAFGIAPEGVVKDSKPQIAQAKRKLPPVPPPPARGPSPARLLVQAVWENRCGSTEHSWRRVNDAMHSALALAIRGGLSFALNDFGEIADGMRGGYWMGDAESFYRMAIEEGHTRACMSMEAYWKRKPFMWEGKRLHVGSSLQWASAETTVTSIRGDSLIACSYKPRGHRQDYSPGIAKRFTITREDLARAEADRKVEVQVLASSQAAQKALHDADVFAPIDVIVKWSPEERAAAAEWAKNSKGDARKKRVRPAPPPACVAAAVVVDERTQAEKKLAEALRARKWRAEEVTREAEQLAELDAEIATLRATIGEGAADIEPAD